MTGIHEVRQRLAVHLGDALDLEPALPYVPSTLRANSLFVRPRAGDYVTFDSQMSTVCQPTIALSVLIVTSIADWQAAAEWLDTKIDASLDALKTDPTLDGTVSDLMLESVGEPFMVNTNTGDFLAAELRLRPFIISH